MKTNIIGIVLRGVVAGAIGAWAMDRMTWLMLDRQAREAIACEKRARPEHLDVSHLLGYRLAAAAGVDTHRGQPTTLGMLTHYFLGIGPATVYAAVRERDLGFSRDLGLLYGLTIFVLWDELLSVATGIANRPGRYPWQAHVRGLVGHLSLGAATHLALTALETDFGIRPIEAHRGA